jgi:Ca2+-binding RTX toxin-like protein
VIYGYGGNDRIYGLGCNDSIIAGNGNDRVYLKDGTRDAANGGPGRDRCAADRQDAVSGCP